MTLLLIYELIAIVEFFLINWLGGISISSGYYQISFLTKVEEAPLFNVVFRVVAPTVFLILTASAWYALGIREPLPHYWAVTVCYFLTRWGYNLAVGRRHLTNWPRQGLVAGVATALPVWSRRP